MRKKPLLEVSSKKATAGNTVKNVIKHSLSMQNSTLGSHASGKSRKEIIEELEHELKLAMSVGQERIIITVLFVVVLLMALYIPSISKVFGLIGATMANLIAFILPGSFFIKACSIKKSKAKKIAWRTFYLFMGWVLVIFGVISLVVATTSQIIFFGDN